MFKSTFATATVIALLSATAQAEQTHFDGLTVSGALVGQAYSDIDNDYDNTRFSGFGVQLDYSINQIVGVTGGYNKTSSSDFGDGISAKTERFYSGINLGYRFESQQWAVKPFGAIGINTLKADLEGTYSGNNVVVNEQLTKPYIGAGVFVSYKQITASLESDASMLNDDILFVESRLTLGYRF